MPIKAYFDGSGDQVMRDMVARYGTRKGRSVFYATANKQQANASPKRHKMLAQFVKRH